MMRMRRETRLRVLSSLPQLHADYVCAAVREQCARYIASLGIRLADRDSETLELFSEVMAKLLGATAASGRGQADQPDDIGDESEPANGDDRTVDEAAMLGGHWTIDERDPKRDGRVIWLIEEIGGRRALSHRYEDMRRQRFGRWQGSGYRTVQISALHGEVQTGESDDEALARYADRSHPLLEEQADPRQVQDTRWAWVGLLALAERQFKPVD